MSWLGRLFGRGPAVEPPPPPASPPPPPASLPEPSAPPASVRIAGDLAVVLTSGGVSLEEAVDEALRSHLAAVEAGRGQDLEGRIPFWLTRERHAGEGDVELEDRLRDRLEQRRAAEEGGGSA